MCVPISQIPIGPLLPVQILARIYRRSFVQIISLDTNLDIFCHLLRCSMTEIVTNVAIYVTFNGSYYQRQAQALQSFWLIRQKKWLIPIHSIGQFFLLWACIPIYLF